MDTTFLHESPRFQCDDIGLRLDDYLDQELMPLETQLILEHLDICQHCATECLGAYSDLAEMRQTIRRVAMPVGLLQAVSAILGGPSD